MRAVSITDLKNNLRRYLDEVKSGHEVLIKDRNKLVARITSLPVTDDDDAELLTLAAEGKVRLPEQGADLPESFWKDPLPKVSSDVLRLLKEERNER